MQYMLVADKALTTMSFAILGAQKLPPGACGKGKKTYPISETTSRGQQRGQAQDNKEVQEEDLTANMRPGPQIAIA